MKVLKVLLIIFSVIFLSSSHTVSKKQITLYLPSSKTQKLIVVQKDIILKSDDDLSDVIFSLLKQESKGVDYIDLYSDDSYARLQNNKAQVLINKNHLRDASLSDELLTIYSVVNSLTSSGDIVTVEFLIDGKSQKNLYGYIDMRESFIPDYDICS